jgi:hypothetical protein
MSSPKQDAGLDIAWARTEMTPYEWEPENDNDSPGDTDCGYLGKHDRPGSNLRREFLLAKQIQDMGVPYAISIWALPKWLYEHTYALPAANDPEALRYCGAIGFHSWGGAKPGQYAAWGDLAERLKLPLLHAHFARGVVVRIECVCSPSAGI